VRVRFLIDEHLSLDYVRELRRHAPEIDVLRIGMPGAPVLGTLDPAILLFCEQHQRALVTQDHATMPNHETAHLEAGHHHWGIFKLRRGQPFGTCLAELSLIWEASEAEEWFDQSSWLPL
jgi:hypothetical protein